MLNEESLTTIKYDDIVLFSERVLQTILGNNHNQIEMLEPLKPSVIRTGKREVLDSDDYHAIEEICLPLAEALGLIEQL